jgi:glycosyltransferase involved in cell wall biosynthesis
MTGQRLGLLLGADSLLGRRSGVGRMTLQIARTLRDHPAIGALSLMAGNRVETAEWLDTLGDEHEALTPSARASRASGLKARIAGVPGLARLRSVSVRRRMNEAAKALGYRVGEPVVYHETNMIARPFDGVSVVTVNDLSFRFPDSLHPPNRVAWIERRLPASLAQATRLVAISEFTAREMVAHLGVERQRIDVVPLAPSEIFRPIPRDEAAPVLAARGLTSGGFVLSVSTLEPRKNFDRLLAAHAQLPGSLRARFPLVIAGGRGWGEALAGTEAEQALRAGTLRLLGHVSDGELAALYSSCAVFAYPSLYEGFGLPVIEAMASGAPVVASRTTATGETAGDAALLIDPFTESEIADALARTIEDAALATRLRQSGFARARAFTWPRTVEVLLATWRRALAGG